MNRKELEFSNLLLNMSNTILEYFKKYGFDSTKQQATSSKKQQDIIVDEQDIIVDKQEQFINIDEQEQFINVDNSKVELVSSQKEQKSIIPLLIGGWILYKILK